MLMYVQISVTLFLNLVKYQLGNCIDFPIVKCDKNTNTTPVEYYEIDGII